MKLFLVGADLDFCCPYGLAVSLPLMGFVFIVLPKFGLFCVLALPDALKLLLYLPLLDMSPFELFLVLFEDFQCTAWSLVSLLF